MTIPLAARGRLIGSWILAFAMTVFIGTLHAEEAEWETLFDGKTLKNWDGNPQFWNVEEGAITGVTTKDNPTKGNTFIIWRGGKLGDFELTLDYKIIGGNSGIQYRSFEVPNQKWVIGGYQGDFEAGKTYSGILYGEKFRGILCRRGQKTELTRENGKFKVKTVGTVGDSDEIQSKIKNEDWNTYRIVAKGNHFEHYINGVKTAECTDNDEKERRAEGLLALQLHAGPPMKVQFKNIKLKRLGDEKKAAAAKEKLIIYVSAAGESSINGKKLNDDKLATEVKKAAPKLVEIRANPRTHTQVVQAVVRLCQKQGVERFSLQGDGTKVPKKLPFSVFTSLNDQNRKKIVLIAGTKSHGYGSHEHKAGCMLLAEALNASGLPVQAQVVTEGWPKDESILDDADSIVIYADGGGRHPFNKHLDKIDSLMDKSVGLVCIHYGVEVPKGPSGDAFLNWTGGYFETDWSVNPHWVAEYDKLPKHAITRGIKPFKINDEWYYHMRFRERMAGVTPILSDLPPKQTLSRKDGPHSGNKFVREAVAAGQSQHTAWATDREDGGRGFGFTGGHYHWNWGHDEFRQLMLNAIAWTAHVEVPENGVPSKTLTVKDLMANQDYNVPGNFNPERIQKMIDEWNQ